MSSRDLIVGGERVLDRALEETGGSVVSGSPRAGEGRQYLRVVVEQKSEDVRYGTARC